MLVVVVTDWRWQRIPNVVTFPTMALGLLLGLAEGLGSEGGPAYGGIGAPFVGGLLDHAAGLFLGLAVSYPFYATGGLKAGDAKMLMAIGAVRGSVFLLHAALYGALAGGVLALVLIASRRLIPPETDVTGSVQRVMKSSIPYGVALGIGALIALALRP